MPDHSAIRAVIWDLGGVLVRTEDYTPRDSLAARLGLDRMGLEGVVFSGDSGDRAQRGEIEYELHWHNVSRLLNQPPETIPELQDAFWGGDVVDRELIEAIRSLRPRYKTGLLSNAFSDLRRFVTQVWQFADIFDELIISAEVGLVKPDPRIYQLAVSRLGVKPDEAVFIDDFAHNVAGAQAVGLHAIQFLNRQQVLEDLHIILNGHQL